MRDPTFNRFSRTLTCDKQSRDGFEDSKYEAKAKVTGLRGQGQCQGQWFSKPKPRPRPSTTDRHTTTAYTALAWSHAVKLCKYFLLNCYTGHFFYSAPQCSHCKRCISYGNSVCPSVRLSVCPSVCPTYAGIVSKRRHVARCSLHRWIAKCV